MTGQLDDILRGRTFKKYVRGCFEQLRGRYDIRQVEVEILIFLSRKPESSAAQICRVLDLNKGQVSTALLDLCVKRFIRPLVSPCDRRCTTYSLLEKGVRCVAEAEEVQKQAMQQIKKGISDQELATASCVAHKVMANIREEMSRKGSAG